MANFDERSGIVPSKTEWGQWWQTIDEIFIEVIIPSEFQVASKDIKCEIKIKSISVNIKGKVIFEGFFPSPIQADESIWTLEDKKLLRICLTKSNATAKNCWPSLLKDKYQADPVTFDEMEKKLTLQRFQIENPGFDFSGASLSGNYHAGGPELPS